MCRVFNIKNGLLLLVVLLGTTIQLFAASVELWPSDRRRNQTQYCYGNDWNMLRFGLYSDQNPSANSNSNGKYKFELPKSFTKDTVLEVTLPKAVEFLGVYKRGDECVGKEFKTTVFTKDGREYFRVRIPLSDEMLNRYMPNNGHYEIHVWYKSPEYLNDTLNWCLTYGEKRLASSTLRLRTAGVLRNRQALPKRFGFYPYGNTTMIPNDDFKMLADFYKRFGITGIISDWSYGLPQSNAKLHKMLEANRKHGVKNIANMGEFCDRHSRGLATAFPETIMKTAGLIDAMSKACAEIESEAAKKNWEAASQFFDMALYDWEPAGPNTWPGYDDKAAVAAFAKFSGLSGPPSQKLLRTKYRESYARFRMEQTARPLYALKNTINSVQSVPIFIEHGDGVGSNIKYDIYGNDFERLRPMIYRTSPSSYAKDLIEMLKNTAIPAKKFAPDLTIGWPQTCPHRESPEEFLLDTIVTAAAGCGGVSHWPELYRTDAALFGIHEGLARIALVEDFYFDGKATNEISIKGISYRENIIKVGKKEITLYGPDWQPVLFSFVHKLKDEYLLTIINYHTTQDAFVEISSPVLSKFYLADPVSRVYSICDNNGRAIVWIPRESPALLIVTTDTTRISGYKQIESGTIESQFKEAKERFLKTNKDGNVKLGKVGDISVSYDQTDFGGKPQVCLRVSTSEQSVFFGDSGGRIYDWKVRGMPAFVENKNTATDGFGMDMLWLPENARWSGDEVRPMELSECENDGKKACITYEGEFKSALAGFKISKKYSVPASGTSVIVDVRLKNDQAGPVMISYWQRNLFKIPVACFVTDGKPGGFNISGTSVFTAGGLPKEYHKYVVDPQKIAGTTRSRYAEFYPESKTGLVFQLPDNFMAVYRWNDPGRGMRSSEWMTCPMNIPAGGIATLQYSITAVPTTFTENVLESFK